MNKKIIIFIIVLLLLIIVAYFIFFKQKNNYNNNWLDMFDPSEEEPTYPIKLGSAGKEVLAVQKAINTVYINRDMATDKPFPLDEDGVYGPLTQAAVIRYLGGTRGNIKGQVSFSEAKKLEKMLPLYAIRSDV